VSIQSRQNGKRSRKSNPTTPDTLTNEEIIIENINDNNNEYEEDYTVEQPAKKSRRISERREHVSTSTVDTPNGIAITSTSSPLRNTSQSNAVSI
jgi:hypothetical protein